MARGDVEARRSCPCGVRSLVVWCCRRLEVRRRWDGGAWPAHLRGRRARHRRRTWGLVLRAGGGPRCDRRCASRSASAEEQSSDAAAGAASDRWLVWNPVAWVPPLAFRRRTRGRPSAPAPPSAAGPLAPDRASGRRRNASVPLRRQASGGSADAARRRHEPVRPRRCRWPLANGLRSGTGAQPGVRHASTDTPTTGPLRRVRGDVVSRRSWTSTGRRFPAPSPRAAADLPHRPKSVRRLQVPHRRHVDAGPRSWVAGSR